jgi:hypothetical protein
MAAFPPAGSAGSVAAGGTVGTGRNPGLSSRRLGDQSGTFDLEWSGRDQRVVDLRGSDCRQAVMGRFDVSLGPNGKLEEQVRTDPVSVSSWKLGTGKRWTYRHVVRHIAYLSSCLSSHLFQLLSIWVRISLVCARALSTCVALTSSFVL